MALNPLDINKILKKLPPKQKEKVRNLIDKISSRGDHIFEDKVNPLDDLSDITIKYLVPTLISALNIPDLANHEPCTAVALLLKLSKDNKKIVLQECQKALKENGAPTFYLTNIINKLVEN